MGLLSGLWRRLAPSASILDNPRYNLNDPEAWDYLGGRAASSGMRITPEVALTHSPWWRGISLLASYTAKVPLRIFRRTDDGIDKDRQHPAYFLLRRKPNPHQTAFQYRLQLTAHALSNGNGYAYIQRDGYATPKELWPLNPATTYPVREQIEGGPWKVWYVVETSDGMRKLAAEDVLHIKGLGYDGLAGYSVVEKAKDSIGLGLGGQKYQAIGFKNGGRPGVILEAPGKLLDKAKGELREAWERMHAGLEQSHRTAVLDQGLQAKAISFSNEDAQILQTRQWNVVDVANFLNLPPHKLGHMGRSGYASLEQENQSFLDDSLDYWLVNWEEECWDKLLTEDEKINHTHVIEFDRRALVRGDKAAEANYWRTALGGRPWAVPDEARAAMHMNALGGEAAEYLNPLNMGKGGPDNEEKPAPPAPPRVTPEPEKPKKKKDKKTKAEAALPIPRAAEGEDDIARDGLGRFAPEDGSSDEARDQHDEAREATRDKEDERVDSGRSTEDDRRQEQHDREDATRESARDEATEARQERQSAEVDAQSDHHEKEDAKVESVREKEDEKLEKQREKEDDAHEWQVEKKRDKEDTRTEKDRDKEDATHEKAEEKLGEREDKQSEKRDEEDVKIQDRRDKEDEKIQERHEKEQKEFDLGTTTEQSDEEIAELQNELNERQAQELKDVETPREAEDKALEEKRAAEDAELKSAQDKLDQDKADRDARREKEDADRDARREKEDADRAAVSTAREKEDEERQTQRNAEDLERVDRQIREDKELAARHETEDKAEEDRQAKEDAEVERQRLADDHALEQKRAHEDAEREKARRQEDEQTHHERKSEDVGKAHVDPALIASLRANLVDAARRVVRRIAHHACRTAKKPAAYCAWLDGFRAEHRDVCCDMLAAPLRAIAASRNSLINADAVAAQLLDRLHVPLSALADSCTEKTLAGAVEQTCAELEQALPAAMAAKLMGE